MALKHKDDCIFRWLFTKSRRARPGRLQSAVDSDLDFQVTGGLGLGFQVKKLMSKKKDIEVEAAMEMKRHLDGTGVHRVCTIYV